MLEGIFEVARMSICRFTTRLSDIIDDLDVTSIVASYMQARISMA